MEAISVSQMVRALHIERAGQASWEQDAITQCFKDSHCGIKTYRLSLRQCELVSTIFHRIYDAKI